jgi:Dyp-type peroxidase family
MAELNKHDMQGLIARGYGGLPFAQFLLLEVKDAGRARDYLRRVHITDAKWSPTDTALHVAFTWQGLKELGVPTSALASFAREFIEGMDHEVRAKALGDQGVNDPQNWAWGHEKKPHVLLMLYAKNESTFVTFVKHARDAIEGAFTVMADQSTSTSLHRDQKEHFAWRDGISTPIVQEFGSKEPVESWTFPVRAGEFVLGYENEYKAYTESPTVDPADDLHDLLPPTRDLTAKDLGINGTYLVYRQMTQDVQGLWKYLADQSREPGADRVERAIALGAKMVGRWPGGAPLAMSTLDDPALASENTFTYAVGKNPVTGEKHGDLNGLACPLGSHIRRSNPRDDLPTDRGDQNSVEMVRKHQMIRRGRAFGAPLVQSMDPKDILAMSGPPDRVPRGLHFICLVGHIGRQFEFVQRAWINSPNFSALFKDADPILGVHRTETNADGNASDELTVQAEPVRRKYKGLPQFTQLVGGAYFFLPGIKAVRFIAGPP